jgi:hypothetical protein
MDYPLSNVVQFFVITARVFPWTNQKKDYTQTIPNTRTKAPIAAATTITEMGLI